MSLPFRMVSTALKDYLALLREHSVLPKEHPTQLINAPKQTLSNSLFFPEFPAKLHSVLPELLWADKLQLRSVNQASRHQLWRLS